MSKYVYPAVFTLEDNGIYSINFPDFESCFTQGSDIPDGLEMAKDILSITLCDMEDDKETIPTPSNPLKIHTSDDEFVTLIAVDTIEYRKSYSGKAIKKTLTIPSWLNSAAEKENINFSSVLQQALKEQLHIER